MPRSGIRSRRAWPSMAGAIAWACLLGLLHAPVADAQSVDIPAMVTADERVPPTVATFQYGHQFESDVEDVGTEMERDNALFSLGHRVELSEDTQLFLLGTYTLHAYDFGGNTGPLSYYRWNEVHRFVLAGMVGHQLTDEWTLLAGGVYRSWGETGADYADSITGGVVMGFEYRRSQRLAYGLLMGFFSRLEDGVGVLPVPTLDWRFADAWTWRIGLVSLMDPGVGSTLEWRMADGVAFTTGFAFQSREFRLRDRTRVTPTPGRPNRTDDGGVGSERNVPFFGELSWSPTPRMRFGFQAGVSVGGNLRVEDEDGGRIQDDDYDPAPFVAIRGSIAF